MAFYSPAGLPVIGTLSYDDYVLVGDATDPNRIGRASVSALVQTGFGFGATGAAADGVTDDAAAINAAITAANAAGGGTVYLQPSKTYYIASRLDMATNVRLVGDETTIVHVDRPFRANALTGGGIEGIRFEGSPGIGGLVQNCTGFTIDRCDFDNQASSVALTGTTNGCRVAFCTFTDSAGSALELNGTGVTGNNILFNTFTNNTGFGIWVTGGAYSNLIEGNKTFANGLELVGITYESHRNRLVGNHAEGCGDNGISVTGMFNVLTGNVTRANAFHGLCLYGSRNVVVGHNAMNNGTAGAGYAGIAFTTGFGGIASFNSITGAFLDDDQSSPTQAHCWKINSGSYTAWANGQVISGAGIYRRNANKLYRSTGAGTTGVTAPTHTTGTVSDGAVSWLYVDTFGSTDDEPAGNVLSGIVTGRALTSVTLDSTQQQQLALEGRSHPGYIASGRYTFWNGATTNVAPGAIDTIYFYPYYVPRRIVIASMAVRVATGGAGSSVKVGIWANDPDTGRPVGAPLVVNNTGAATTGTGEVGLSGTGTLEPGWYWFGSKYTGTLPSMVSANGVLGGSFPNGSNLSATHLSFADTYSNNMPTLASGASFTAVSAGAAPIISALT